MVMNKCTDEFEVCCKSDEFNKCDTYAECVYRAFYDKNDGKYPHQRHITKDTLNEYKQNLLEIENEFKKCVNFDEIYELFKKHRIYGIGDLTIYDVALRVSQNYGIYPDKLYLHAGTRVGAFKAGLIPKYSRKHVLSPADFPEEFDWLRGVEPYLIEDFLCIYKDDVNEKNLKIFLQK